MTNLDVIACSDTKDDKRFFGCFGVIIIAVVILIIIISINNDNGQDVNKLNTSDPMILK